MSSSMIPKPSNFYPIRITTSYELEPNTYNVVYSSTSTPASLTLPDLTTVIDGFPIHVLNQSAFALTVLLADDVTTLATVGAGQLLVILADKTTGPAWRIQNGPAASTGITSGPTSSTDTAVALWNGATGQLLRNSVVLISSLGVITGVSSISLATTGGTATPLNYYEELPLTGNTFTGGVSVAQPCVIQLTRVGRKVTALFPSIIGTGVASVLTSTIAIPARFLPSATTGGYGYLKFPIRAQDNSLTATAGQTAGEGQLNVATGIITIGVAGATGAIAFTAGNSAGFASFATEWSV